jgi:hypothetical protein
MYSITGFYEGTGMFEVERRYKDFRVLRKFLTRSWPGCFIPALPPKQPMGNLDFNFVLQRQALLDNFLKKCCSQPHLFFSPEIQAFLQPSLAKYAVENLD